MVFLYQYSLERCGAGMPLLLDVLGRSTTGDTLRQKLQQFNIEISLALLPRSGLSLSGAVMGE